MPSIKYFFSRVINCRVSFIDLYLVFPRNFRMVFLPYTKTVILLERYCGTITEPGLPVTELENRPSSQLTNTALQLLGEKLSLSKQLAWNLNNVSHKVIENTKQVNSSSLSTYFMISVTERCKSADLCSNVKVP